MDDEQELEVIRSEMEDKRSSLTEKLEALENQVVGKVETAAGAVASTVETVTGTVQAVKDALDVRKHVERRPWLMVGGAVAVGFVGGYLLPSGRPRRPDFQALASDGSPKTTTGNGHSGRPGHRDGHGRRHAAKEEGALSQAFQGLKGLAIGAVMDLLRDLATKALPPAMAPDIASVVNDLNAKLGGKPLRNPNAPEAQPCPGPEETGRPEGRGPSETGRPPETTRHQARGRPGHRH